MSKRKGDLGDSLTGSKGPVIADDEDNTPDGPQKASATEHTGGGIDFTPKGEAPQQTPEGSGPASRFGTTPADPAPVPQPTDPAAPRKPGDPEAAQQPKKPDTPADLYAEAVGLHGVRSEQAAKIRLEHQGDAAFQAVADWIDHTGVGVLRAGTAKAAAEPRGAKRYRVSHQDVPAHEVSADNEHQAVEEYKKWAGIISTPHRFQVEEL